MFNPLSGTRTRDLDPWAVRRACPTFPYVCPYYYFCGQLLLHVLPVITCVTCYDVCDLYRVATVVPNRGGRNGWLISSCTKFTPQTESAEKACVRYTRRSVLHVARLRKRWYGWLDLDCWLEHRTPTLVDIRGWVLPLTSHGPFHIVTVCELEGRIKEDRHTTVNTISCRK